MGGQCAEEKTMSQYFLSGKPVKSIWISNVQNPYLARHLIIPARRVIGFWSYHSLAIRDKARVCGLSPGEFIGLNRMLWTCDNVAVSFCRRNGLPASASVSLMSRFNCPECHKPIVSLPCILCWCGEDDDPDVK